MSRPVLVLQPQDDDGPAWLATWLHAQGQAITLCRIERGDAVPTDPRDWRGIAVLGGAMSVNDDLPWLRAAEALLRTAIDRGVPVIGHCLGGQLLARALGAAVTDNPVPEIGWSRVASSGDAAARDWLGDALDWPAFQWHYQTFALPTGAHRIAHNPVCANQAFVRGPHLGMQFHIEVDAEKLARWAHDADPEVAALPPLPSVQDGATQRAGTTQHLAHSQRIAAGLYARWLQHGAGLAG